MALTDPLWGLFMPLIPKNSLSHFVGRLAHRELPEPLARRSVEWFAKHYKLNMEEAEHPLSEYPTVGELFTRRLKPGARPIGEGFVHPADAVITEAGPIVNGTLIQAKGFNYSLSELLHDPGRSQGFVDGHYMTYYLCPTDYHRVHSPVDGRLLWSCHVPGTMWPVNDWSVRKVPSLFTRNERVVMLLETERGRAALVMVAATNVGNMSFTFDDLIQTNARPVSRVARASDYPKPIQVKRGDELGVFRMGSTVVMVYEKGMLPADPVSLKGKAVKMGGSVFA